MFTIEEVTFLFKDGAAKLPPITGNLTNNDLKRLCAILSNLLQAVELPVVTDAEGLITTEADYKASHAGVTLNCLDALLEACKPSILSDTKTTDCMRAKHEWTENLLIQRLLRAAKCGARTLILRFVEDTLSIHLKTPQLIIISPPPQYITDHLAANSGRLEDIDSVALQQAMTNWWREDPRVSEYVNRLKDGQKKAARVSLPILDKWITAIATSSILAKNIFPTAR